MTLPAALLDHLLRMTRLGPAECERLVAEVLAYHDETADGFVQRRHGELKARGLKNPEIFERLQVELGQRRFAAPELSQRQLRRIIYG